MQHFTYKVTTNTGCNFIHIEMLKDILKNVRKCFYYEKYEYM